MLGLVQPKLPFNGVEASAVMIEDDGHFLEMKIDPLDVGIHVANFTTESVNFGAYSNLPLCEHGDLCADFCRLLRGGFAQFLK